MGHLLAVCGLAIFLYMTVLFILALVGINYAGVRQGAFLQNVLTVIKFVALAGSAERIDSDRSLTVDEIRQIVDILDPRRDELVIEIGAGIGQMTEGLKPLAGITDLLCIEPDAGFCQAFRRRRIQRARGRK